MNACCSKPRIANSDYKRYASWTSIDYVVVTNRHCMHCGAHQHDGKQYTRAEWDSALSRTESSGDAGNHAGWDRGGGAGQRLCSGNTRPAELSASR